MNAKLLLFMCVGVEFVRFPGKDSPAWKDGPGQGSAGAGGTYYLAKKYP